MLFVSHPQFIVRTAWQTRRLGFDERAVGVYLIHGLRSGGPRAALRREFPQA